MHCTRLYNKGTRQIPNTANTVTLNTRLHKAALTAPLNSGQRTKEEGANT
jgi:hypothetical protein